MIIAKRVSTKVGDATVTIEGYSESQQLMITINGTVSNFPVHWGSYGPHDLDDTFAAIKEAAKEL